MNGHRVEITGWRKGLQRVPVTKLLAHAGGLGLEAAKHSFEHILAGDHIVVAMSSEATALELARSLRIAGAEARAVPPSPAV